MTEPSEEYGKVCTKCGIYKPMEAFYPLEDRPGQFSQHCKQCSYVIWEIYAD